MNNANSEEEAVRIVSNGNVGIGVTDPTARLVVLGSNQGIQVRESDDGQVGVMLNADSTNGALRVYNKGEMTTKILGGGPSYINTGHAFGINTDNPNSAYDLHVNGKIYATSCTGCTSDERLKKAIEPVRNALAKVLAITGVTFEFDQANHPEMNLPEGRQMGLIAQEVEQVAPELVMTPEGDGFKAIKYGNAVALVIEAMKEQHARIERLEAENAELKRRLTRLDELEKRLLALETR